MTRTIRRFALVVSALMVMVAATVAAQEPSGAASAAGGLFGAEMLHDLVAAVIYSILGIIILMIGFKVLDIVTPFDLNKEIAEDDNPAAGVVVAGMMIALGIIVAAAIL
jgi:uncharacterized membrane protein YjfL (UPF0719 family)